MIIPAKSAQKPQVDAAKRDVEAAIAAMLADGKTQFVVKLSMYSEVAQQAALRFCKKAGWNAELSDRGWLHAHSNDVPADAFDDTVTAPSVASTRRREAKKPSAKKRSSKR